MRIHRLAFLLIMVAVSLKAHCQTDGKVTASSYENAFFKFSYQWPNFLRPYPIDSLAVPRSASANEYLLFSARQGKEPYGVVVVAERLHVVTSHSKGLQDGADFLDRVARFNPEQHAVLVSRRHLTNASGIVVDVLDYTENGEPSSAIAAHVENFLIVFKCNAKSAGELDEMDRSALSIKSAR